MTTLARVLVVDDEVHVAEVLRDYFEEEGYEVRMALDGRTALAIVDAWRPHVVLLDLRMPGMSGAEVFTRIRAMHASAMVTFVTGADDETLARQLLREGAADYVQKPIDLDYCALAVLFSVSESVGGGPPPPELAPLTRALYGLVQTVRHLDDVSSVLRQELEELAYAALRETLRQRPERTRAHLQVFARRLVTAASSEVSARDRAMAKDAVDAVGSPVA